MLSSLDIDVPVETSDIIMKEKIMHRQRSLFWENIQGSLWIWIQILIWQVSIDLCISTLPLLDKFAISPGNMFVFSTRWTPEVYWYHKIYMKDTSCYVYKCLVYFKGLHDIWHENGSFPWFSLLTISLQYLTCVHLNQAKHSIQFLRSCHVWRIVLNINGFGKSFLFRRTIQPNDI
jgi:hypothetical protein